MAYKTDQKASSDSACIHLFKEFNNFVENVNEVNTEKCEKNTKQITWMFSNMSFRCSVWHYGTFHAS